MSTGCTRSSARPEPATKALTAGTRSAATTEPSEASSSAPAAAASCCSSPRTARLCVGPWSRKVCAKSASPSITKAPRCWRGTERVQIERTMQCVILAGGLGTRMRPFTDVVPKTLLPVRGRPFAWYQLDWLARHGVTEVVYCIGHQGDQIRRYWKSRPAPPAGSQWPALRWPKLIWVDEGEQLRGTAGALRLALAEGALDESFFVLYGDSFLPIDFAPIWTAFQSSRARALMTVLRNEGRWDSSNVVYSNGLVTLYDKRAPNPHMHFIDYGLSAFHRSAIEQSEEADLSTLFRRLSLA